MIRITPQELVVTVRDQGAGFLTQRRLPTNLDSGSNSTRVSVAKKISSGASSEEQIGEKTQNLSTLSNGTTPVSNTESLTSQIAVHGRGLTLIEKAMDRVSYADNGRELTMVKFLNSKEVL